MLEYKRTNGKNKDFIENCRRLDADLDQRVGKEIQRSKYEKYNQLDKINEAKLVSLLIEWAKELGYQRMLLETGEKLTESVALYKKLGFERIPNYGSYESMPESLCMAKDI